MGYLAAFALSFLANKYHFFDYYEKLLHLKFEVFAGLFFWVWWYFEVGFIKCCFKYLSFNFVILLVRTYHNYPCNFTTPCWDTLRFNLHVKLFYGRFWFRYPFFLWFQWVIWFWRDLMLLKVVKKRVFKVLSIYWVLCSILINGNLSID